MKASINLSDLAEYIVKQKEIGTVIKVIGCILLVHSWCCINFAYSQITVVPVVYLHFSESKNSVPPDRDGTHTINNIIEQEWDWKRLYIKLLLPFYALTFRQQ